jgi:uncharacterized protein
MNRAYSVLNVKSVNQEKRILAGMATTPSVDRVGDIIDPKGIQFKNPMPFLWQHDHRAPIGTVTFEEPTEEGIVFSAEIARVAEPGVLKDRTDEAWQSIELGLVRAVSIGFRPIEYSFMDNGGVRFSSCEVFELSAVTIPANADAVITAIKSIDTDLRKKLGIKDATVDKHAALSPMRVVRMDQPLRDRSEPYVLRTIIRNT